MVLTEAGLRSDPRERISSAQYQKGLIHLREKMATGARTVPLEKNELLEKYKEYHFETFLNHDLNIKPKPLQEKGDYRIYPVAEGDRYFLHLSYMDDDKNLRDTRFVDFNLKEPAHLAKEIRFLKGIGTLRSQIE